MANENFSERGLAALAAAVEKRLSPYRMAHTRGVEKTAAWLASLYAPEDASLLRAAALLHDITKEYSDDAQRDLMKKAGITLRPDENDSPKIWHAITAPLVIRAEYPDFAAPALLSAVRWHTTLHEGVNELEALLYLADYIEEGRRFADCVELREFFLSKDVAAMPLAARRRHLYDTIFHSLTLTIEEFRSSGQPLCRDTIAAHRELMAMCEIPKRAPI